MSEKHKKIKSNEVLFGYNNRKGVFSVLLVPGGGTACRPRYNFSVLNEINK